MISWDSPVMIGVIGFIGGVIGGLIINIVSIHYQKRIEKKIEDGKTEKEYYASIKTLLNEIIETWEKEKIRDYIDRQRIKNDFDIYSHQLTSLIASSSIDFPSGKLSRLRELSSSLNKINDITIGIGADLVQRFNNQVDETVDLAKKIREEYYQI